MTIFCLKGSSINRSTWIDAVYWFQRSSGQDCWAASETAVLAVDPQGCRTGWAGSLLKPASTGGKLSHKHNCRGSLLGTASTLKTPRVPPTRAQKQYSKSRQRIHLEALLTQRHCYRNEVRKKKGEQKWDTDVPHSHWGFLLKFLDRPTYLNLIYFSWTPDTKQLFPF